MPRFAVMAFSDTAGVTGGNLIASFKEPPPAPSVDLTVDDWATALPRREHAADRHLHLRAVDPGAARSLTPN